MSCPAEAGPGVFGQVWQLKSASSQTRPPTLSLLYIQCEVSQKEKNKYRSLTHIYGIQKNGTDELLCRAGIGFRRADLWTQRGQERVGRIERAALTYIRYYM